MASASCGDQLSFRTWFRRLTAEHATVRQNGANNRAGYVTRLTFDANGVLLIR